MFPRLLPIVSAISLAFPLVATATVTTYDENTILSNVQKGLLASQGNTVNYYGETIKVSSYQWAGCGGSGQTQNSVLNVGKNGYTKLVDLKASWDQEHQKSPIGLLALGNKDKYGPKVSVNAETVKIYAEVDSQASADANGIAAQNGTYDSSLDKNARAQISINADNIYIDARSNSTELPFKRANAIFAISQGMVDIEGNLYVNTQGGNGQAIQTRGGAIININQSGKHTVQLNGDIAFGYAGNSQTPIDADVNILLNGKDSYWKGNSTVIWSSNADPEKLTIEKKSEFGLKQWGSMGANCC